MHNHDYARYSSFSFTADSQIVLDQAHENFQHFPYTVVTRLNIEEDPIEQGFDAEWYNIILAPSTVMKNDRTLSHIRKIIKPDGKLILHEPRQLCIPDQKLVDGESPENLSMRNFASPDLGTSTMKWIELSPFLIPIYDSMARTSTQREKYRVFVVLDSRSNLQTQTSQQLIASLKFNGFTDVATVGLKEACLMEQMNSQLFIVLLELDQPFIYSMSQDAYSMLHRFLISVQHILWITLSGGSTAGKPECSMIYGLARALYNENQELRLTVVSLEYRNMLSERQIRSLMQVLMHNHVEQNQLPDSEYLEIEGNLTIPRVVPAKDIGDQLYVRSKKRRADKSLVEDAPPLELTVKSPGLLETLHFVEDKSFLQPLANDEVEIETRAIGVNFKDCLTALGQISKNPLGLECAGVITRVGGETAFIPGDRVALATSGCFKSFARGKAHNAIKIPEDMPFTVAAAIPAQFGTAWEAIHRLARLQRDETVLIHAAAGGTGQAAIQIAKLLGATIFATVGSQAKKQLLMDEYKVPKDNIFYSRDTSFAKGIKRVTNGRGVDVVINSLVGEGLLAS